MKFWHKKSNRILTVVLAAVLLLTGSCVRYINDYYHVTDRDGAMSDTTSVSVVKTTTGYLYDGPGEDTALIFYPGAKVQDIAYAPLLKELAESHELMPADFTEYVIEGGNHAQYGDYGVQKGDGAATISAKEQRDIVTEKILMFLPET